MAERREDVNLPFTLLSSLLLAERRRLATQSRAEDHRDAAAVDEVARHVDDDEDDNEHDDRNADDQRHAERQQRTCSGTVLSCLCSQTGHLRFDFVQIKSPDKCFPRTAPVDRSPPPHTLGYPTIISK